ncbi:MAG: PKD domain-containing protein [Saprospiraceae bacterium]|nr:PKD domain-containing protein [Saprospiraceae bacterium]
MRITRIFIAVLFFSTGYLTSQSIIEYQALEEQFSDYEVLNINSAMIYNQIKSADRNNEYTLDLGNGRVWNLYLENSGVLGPDYVTSIATENGVEHTRGFSALPMKGYVIGRPESKVSLTFNHNFIYGYIMAGNEYYNIEPVSHFVQNAKADEYVLYSAKDIRPGLEKKCGYEEVRSETEKIKRSHQSSGERMPGGCYLILYSTASDFSMFTQYGGAVGVQNHNIGVLNNVQGNYDNEFADEIQFQMQQQWISSCSTCDPWTTSTDPNTLLFSFRSWALGGGLNQTHNLASLWTRRNLNDNVVGIAFGQGVLCSSFRYNVLQDFTSNANFKRVLMAHEVGHNFSAEHDGVGSGFIMAPAVNNTTTWSSLSINAIQSEYLSASCLSTCTPVSAPLANFTYNVISQCIPGQVQYTDASTGASTRLWSFPGGTPSTSTLANPLVTYNVLGTFGATLTISGPGGSNTKTVNNIITTSPGPFAEFFYSTNLTNRTVFFNYSGAGAQSYLWNFGDGATSTLPFPSHTYIADGTYTVTLTITGSCGIATSTQQVVVLTYPTADFTATPTTVCQESAVQFQSTSSSNAVTFQWNFPGGNPASSIFDNPQVTYLNHGIFNVALTVTNQAGSNTKTVPSFITVNPLPVPDFSYTINGGTVTFENLSLHSNNYTWNFGDNTTSTDLNPSHTYQTGGIYYVELISSNGCGIRSVTYEISISLAPHASFVISGNNQICEGGTVQYQSTTNNSPSTIQWIFEGGTPATSTIANPNVIYAVSGNYNVTLIASNNFGSDTLFLENYVEVSSIPSVAFTSLIDEYTVQFTSQVLNGADLQWNFGDGLQGQGMNPSHIYTSEGQYLVELTSTNYCGENSFSALINVFVIPDVSFSASNTEICLPSLVQFNSQVPASVTSWLWTFEGGTPAVSNAQNPSVIYSSAGSYPVTLTVTNPAGQNTSVIDNYIVVNDIPSTGISATTDGNIIQLSNTGTGSIQTDWFIIYGDQQVELTGNSVQFFAPQNGLYQITQTNTNECGASTTSLTQPVVISVYPIALFQSDLTEICAGNEISYISTSTNADSYFWQFEGGNPATSTEETPVVQYTQAGNYNVVLQVFNEFGSSEYSFLNSINVNTIPAAQFATTQNANTVAVQNNTSGADSYLWDFGDGFISSELNPSHQYQEEGTFTITLEAENECGESVFSQEVMVDLRLPVVLIQQSVSSGCGPMEVAFSDMSTNEPTQWSWTFEGGTPNISNEQNPIVVYEVPGEYNVTLVVTNDYGNGTIAMNDAVKVYGFPVASFDYTIEEGAVNFQYIGTEVNNYLWNFGDPNATPESSYSAMKNPVHTYTKSGIYIVQLIVANPCGSDTISQQVDIIFSSTYDQNISGNIIIYPNPNSGSFNVSLQGITDQEVELSISDISGRQLNKEKFKVEQGGYVRNINCNDYLAGTYLVKCTTSTGVIIRKMIIQK